MRVAIFSANKFERPLLDELNAGHEHELVYFDTLLKSDTVALAAGFPTVSIYVNDPVDANVLKHLAAGSTKLVARAPPASVRAITPLEVWEGGCRLGSQLRAGHRCQRAGEREMPLNGHQRQ